MCMTLKTLFIAILSTTLSCSGSKQISYTGKISDSHDSSLTINTTHKNVDVEGVNVIIIDDSNKIVETFTTDKNGIVKIRGIEISKIQSIELTYVGFETVNLDISDYLNFQDNNDHYLTINLKSEVVKFEQKIME